MNSPNILPEGFLDILSDAALKEFNYINNAINQLVNNDFFLIKPPMARFSSNTDEAILDNSFQTTDPLTGEQITFRSDMTMPIGRIAATRLASNKRPLKLCYTGIVLRQKGEGLYKERQFTQLGAEIIGQDSDKIELLMQGLEILELAGINDIVIDISLPYLVERITQDQDIADLIMQKDTKALKQVDDKYHLNDLMFGDIKSQLEVLSNILDKSEYDTLIQIVDSLKSKAKISLDLFEKRGFGYHKSLSFSLFSASHKEELGRGGDYKLLLNDEDAIGFSLNVNALMRAIS